jgi:hypothetical protein
MRYWAVRPASQGGNNTRIEKAETAVRACELAFGRSFANPKYNIGHWQAKDLGTRVSVIQSDKKRIELLTAKEGWFDPYQEAK